MSTLKHLVILFETEAACRRRLAAQGWECEPAREIAAYLSQATDLAAFMDRIRAAFQPAGVQVDFFEMGEVEQYLPLLQRARGDCMLWNVTDGFRYYQGSFATSLAALLGVKTFGSPPQAQHLCQDKFKCVGLAQSAGLRVPASALCRDDQFVTPPDALAAGSAFFVKPNTLGAKVGIFRDSQCATLDQALALSRRIWRRYRDDAIVQAFVPGFDVRVSFMNAPAAGQPPQLGIYRLTNVEAGEAGGAFMTMADNWTLSASRSARERQVASPFGRPPAFAPRMLNLRSVAERDPVVAGYVAEIEAMSRRLAQFLDLRDYYSFDFRVSETREVYFLELEVCPAVTIYDFLTYLEETYHIDLPAALRRAVVASFGKHGEPE